MWPWVENPSVMLWQRPEDATEENEHQYQNDQKQTGGEPPKDEPEAARDTEVGIKE
jgi:hypothetical protein